MDIKPDLDDEQIKVLLDQRDTRYNEDSNPVANELDRTQSLKKSLNRSQSFPAIANEDVSKEDLQKLNELSGDEQEDAKNSNKISKELEDALQIQHQIEHKDSSEDVEKTLTSPTEQIQVK